MNERLDRALAIYAAIVAGVASVIAASYKADIALGVLSFEILFLSLLLALGGTFLLTFLMACSLAKTEYALGLLFIDEAVKAALASDKDTLLRTYTPLPLPPLEDQTILLEKLNNLQKNFSTQPSQGTKSKEVNEQTIKECMRPLIVSSSVRMMRVWNSILFGIAAGAAFSSFNYAALPNSDPIPLIMITVFPVASICWYIAYFTFPAQIDHPTIAKPWDVSDISVISIIVGLAMTYGFLFNFLFLAYIFIFYLLFMAALWNTEPLTTPISERLKSDRFWGPSIVGVVCIIIVSISKYAEFQTWLLAEERLATDISTLAFLLSMTLFFYFTRYRADKGLSQIIGKLEAVFKNHA